MMFTAVNSDYSDTTSAESTLRHYREWGFVFFAAPRAPAATIGWEGGEGRRSRGRQIAKGAGRGGEGSEGNGYLCWTENGLGGRENHFVHVGACFLNYVCSPIFYFIFESLRKRDKSGTCFWYSKRDGDLWRVYTRRLRQSKASFVRTCGSRTLFIARNTGIAVAWFMVIHICRQVRQRLPALTFLGPVCLCYKSIALKWKTFHWWFVRPIYDLLAYCLLKLHPLVLRSNKVIFTYEFIIAVRGAFLFYCAWSCEAFNSILFSRSAFIKVKPPAV